MNSVTLNLDALLPLLAGLLLATPVFVLAVMLWRHRSIRLWLFRHRLLRRGWQPVFMKRYMPGDKP
jgi:hypothetical protein